MEPNRELLQRSLELLGNVDLEALTEHLQGELMAVCDAQSAALWLVEESELHLRGYRGLLDKQFLQERLPLQGSFYERMREHAPWLSGEGRERKLHVPLHAAGELVGMAQLADPLSGDFRAESQQVARTLADFGAVALRLARKMSALQRLGLKDRDTAAYNLPYFTDYASKEINKARRYGRTFALMTFSVDNLAQVSLRLGPEEARKATRGIIRALSRLVRDSDVIAKASETELYALLPETDFFGAILFSRRAAQAVKAEPEVQEVEAKLPLSLLTGAATYPRDGEGFDELIHGCRRRMEERRSSLQRKLLLDELPFWEEVQLLLGTPNSPRLPVDDQAEPSRRGQVNDTLFPELQAEVARELLREPGARGILYVGGAEIRSDLPIVSALKSAPPELATRVYVLGRRADVDSHAALTPVFLEGDDQLQRHAFLLWLSEGGSYALLQRQGHGVHWGFHSSDAAVVDGLIASLQAQYDLQPY
ncbi:MAG: GGDEF domain-containing protein [Myxococcaceae bacterium]